MKHVAILISTLFYIGKTPFMPGTLGSLVALIIWYFIPLEFFIQIPLILIAFALGIWASSIMIKEFHDNDPSIVVIDEMVGMWIALLMIPHSPILFVLAFLIFRIFDILKPSFIHDVQKIRGAWGIMLDDVVAALFTYFMILGISTIC